MSDCCMCDWKSPSELHRDGFHYHGKSRCKRREAIPQHLIEEGPDGKLRRKRRKRK